MADTTFDTTTTVTTVYASIGQLYNAAGATADTAATATWTVDNPSLGSVVASTVVATDAVITLTGTEGRLIVNVEGTTNAGATFTGTGTVVVSTPLTATLTFSQNPPA